MGFLTGSSCYLHSSPLCQSRFPSSSSSFSQSTFFHSCARNADTKRKNFAPMACLYHEDPNDGVHRKRRAILFVGISVLPLLQLTARAFEHLGAEERELKEPEENQEAEALQRDAPPNPFLSLLNGIGIISSGVLGAFYALGLSEKTATNAAVESMKSQLKEKEAVIFSLERHFDSKLLNEQAERTKQLRKAKEEQQCLLNQLNSANSVITGLGQELKNEKRLIQELKFQIHSLETSVSNARDDKKALEEDLKEKLDSSAVLEERINLLSLGLKEKEDNVQSLSTSLAEKELELNNLNFTNKQTKDELAKVHSEIQRLEVECLKNQKELELRNSMMDELNRRVSSLNFERDDSKKKLDMIQEEYNDLKSFSGKKAALDSKLLGEKEAELLQLNEKLELAMNEISGNQAVISDLTQERVNLREMLDRELNNVKHLKHELHVTKESLEKSMNEVSDLTNQLERSRDLCTGLEGEISRVQAESSEVRESLQKGLDEAKLSSEMVAMELTSVKELLKKREEELQIVSHELAGVVENGDSLQKELVDVYKRAETTANDLKEEKKVVSSLNKELQALEKQMLKDKEAQKSLETDLEEATKSLDELNRKALSLSRDIEKANSRISDLEDEKEVLYNSLTGQKNASKEAQENMEDAHNLIMRLGKERESLEKRANKLEEQLASAKGEILRLRSRINSSNAIVNNQQPQQGEVEGNVPVTARRNGRRRKASSQ
ncbi:hypothetical protein F2P56_016560 [Juglans regia]|uniref:MAR-binding filament-like protein 1-1 n=2 Tax=Juglans regia TaxID=51240 RepID=A0A834CWN6_JUGRE|nr:MAR-binding filament-like protein 1-1 isoform X2 [Juglans regia]KAF5466653.1 hypothetical protein F2P56_016560 [Juglans regia]